MNLEEVQPNLCVVKLKEKPPSYRQRNLERVREIERKSKRINRVRFNELTKLKRRANPQKSRNESKQWRLNNPEKSKASWKKWYSQNKINRYRYALKYRGRNLERINSVRRKYRIKNKSKVAAWNKSWRSKNPERLKQSQKEYALRNREKITKRQCAYIASRRKRDVQFNLIMRCRSRVWDALKTQDAIKSQRTFNLIGCSPEFLRQFLEAQFTHEMSWCNYGKFWEIDHRIPVSKFDLTNPIQQRQAFHYSNCRPLTSKENNLKKDNMPEPHQALLI